MSKPVAWIEEFGKGMRTIWYVDPIEEGHIKPSEERVLIPMSEGWEDRLRAFEDTLNDDEYAIVIADGEYEKAIKPPPDPEPQGPEEPRTTWNDLADAAREGVNSL